MAGADSEAPLELKDLVTRKATTEFETNPSIRRHDVLHALKVGDEDLAPARCLLPHPKDTLPREQEQEILQTLLDSTVPVVIHAEGGVGKSILAARLAASMPTNSAAVLYDCFGDGLYRSALGLRHRYRDGLVQIANELAARGLCYPLLPTDRADARQYLRAFLGRLTQTVDSLRAKDLNAKLCVIVDAADNAEMAAAEWREPGSFVRELIRAPLPEGVRIAFTCRSHRRSLLNAPHGACEVLLRPFSQAETARHLRTPYPAASDVEVSEFAFLSSSNPRVQAFALAGATSLVEVLKRLGPEPTTVERAIGSLLDAAIARVKEVSGAAEAQQVELICRGLAVFRPLVPVAVLARVSGISEAAVRSFAVDLGRPLLLKGDSVHFLDEPTETWFRERFSAADAELATFVERLRPLADENAYAAAALPQLLLRLGRVDELVRLALSDASLPRGNPLEKRDVKLQRMRFAIKACIQSGNYTSAAKIALKAGGECAGEQRQNQVIKDHTDVAGVLMASDRIEALVARRAFGDSWRGSHYAYEAGLMSSGKEHLAEASSRLRMAEDWLRAWARQPRDQRLHHEHLSDEDVAEIALAMLRLEGPIAAARFLKAWTPRDLSFRAGQRVGRRLIDLGDYDRLDALALAGERDPWLLLGLCVEVNAVGRQLPASALARLLRVLRRPDVKLPDREGGESWRILDAVRSAVELSLCGLPHELEVWAEVLRRYLPAVPLEALSMRYGSDRPRLWRAYALEAALRGVRLNIEAVTPAEFRSRRPGAGTYEEQLFLAEARALLPWFTLSAEIACGRCPSNASEAIQGALKETTGAEQIVYQERKPTREPVAFEWFGILRSISATDEQKASLRSWLLEKEPSLPVDTVIALCRLAARCNGFERFAVRLGEDAYSTLDASREEAQSRADSLLRLARAILSVHPDEARAYFNRAVEIASRIGDENLERWVALLDLAAVAAEPERPRPRTAYRLARIAELTYEYVDRDKHFPWHSTVEAIADLCASSAVAILSRWRDRRFGNSDRLLPLAVNRFLERGLLPRQMPIVLAGITAWWERAGDLRDALEAESDPEVRKRLAKVAFRYIRVSPLKVDGWTPREDETWATMKQLKDRYTLELPDFERLARAAAENAERKKILPDDGNKAQPDWEAVFRETDLSDSTALRSRANEHRGNRTFFREAFARVKPGQEAQFIRAVASWPDFDYFDLRDLLQGLPSPLPNQLALREAVRDAALTVCRHDPLRSQRRGWWDTAPVDVLHAGGLISYGEIGRASLEGIAVQVDRLNASELFQMMGPLSLVLSASEADESLEFGLGLLDEILKPDDGDGEWRAELQPHGTLIEAVAGYVWAGLGSAAAAERWQHAHVVRAIVELGCSDLLRALVAIADADCHAFVDHRLMFYGWHARQWLLVGLARGAIENPQGMRPAHAFLQKILGTRHVLIRELAAQTLRTLCDSGQLDASLIRGLAVNQPGSVKLYSGFGEETAEETADTLPEPEDEDRYHFEPDIGPYWFPPLGRAFGLGRRTIERRALAVIRGDLGWSGGFSWRDDGRLARKIFDEGESSHDHGSLPRSDGILTYLAYHAMMILASDLLDERPVLRRNGAPQDEFDEWMSRYMLTRRDGRWVADRRAPRLITKVATNQEHWRWSVSARYLDEQLTADDALTVLYGEWHNGDSDRYETVSVRSALVSTEGAPSLLAALQTAPTADRFALPYASDARIRATAEQEPKEVEPEASETPNRAQAADECERDDDEACHADDDEDGSDNDVGDRDDDVHDGDVHDDYEGEDDDIDDDDDGAFDAGPLRLSGWLSHQAAEGRLDKYDPWGEGVAFPGPAPSNETVSKLDLHGREGGTVWETPRGGIVRVETFAHSQRSERHDETISGERLGASAQFICDLLTAYPERMLILSVEIRRYPSRYERGNDRLDSYPQPYLRYYLMGADGVASPL